MRAQISTEYLIILGIAIAAIIPAGYFFYQYSSISNDQTIRGQIETIGNEILVNAESMYGLADGSLVSLDVRFPETIQDVVILNRDELVIKYELSTGYTESVFFSNVYLSGNVTTAGVDQSPPIIPDSKISKGAITSGKTSLRFESKTNYVLITKQ